MRLDSLLCQRKRSRWKLYKRHGLPTYENLAAGLRPTTINQLWVADFTYVSVRGRWIFVAVILDAFSRRCVGWSIATHAQTELVLDALQMALRRRRPPPGMLRHSDRGSQYAAADYVTVLEKHGIVPSMSAAGNPYHNALCERFMRTLKTDEIYIREYESIADARKSIGYFLDITYNHRRLHSALGYMPPAEFESRSLEPANQHSLSLT
jgi:transposase InsO family protein